MYCQCPQSNEFSQVKQYDTKMTIGTTEKWPRPRLGSMTMVPMSSTKIKLLVV